LRDLKSLGQGEEGRRTALKAYGLFGIRVISWLNLKVTVLMGTLEAQFTDAEARPL
jgi:hypothetical protein